MAGHGEPHGHSLLREFVVSALYLSLALWATALIVPPDVLPSKWVVVAEVYGIAVGLLLMHWLAFSLAVQLVDHAEMNVELLKEGGAQLAGGLAVAVVATLPFILLNRTSLAFTTAMAMLGAIPALTGYAIARQRGASRATSVTIALGVALIAFAVVWIKVALSY